MKRSLRVCLCVVLLACLSACQKTPVTAPVVNKGDGRLEEQIVAPVKEEQTLDAPARIETEAFGNDTVQIEIDAVVTTPESQALPVVEIEKQILTDEWAKGIMLKMADGRPIYSYEDETVYTKSEIEEEILFIKQILSDPEGYLGEGFDSEAISQFVSDMQAQLALWEDAYQTAPDTFERKEIDLSFSPTPEGSGLRMTGAVDFGKERNAYLTINRPSNGVGGFIEFNNPDDGVGLPFNYDTDSDFKNLNDLTLSREEAIKIGLDYIGKMGESGFEPSFVVVGFCEPRDVDSSLSIEEYPQCYKIIYSRSVEGVPSTYRNSSRDTFIASSDPEELREGAQYAPFWPQEQIEMIVRDSGVNYMAWTMPSGQTAVLNDNVALLGFDDIMEKFTKQILIRSLPSSGDPTVKKRTLVVNRIELGMVQIRNKDEYKSLLMIPAWNFFGKEILQYDGPRPGGYLLNENNEYINELPGYSYLTVNAIDGSVINPALGY